MRISDWSSDVCSSDLGCRLCDGPAHDAGAGDGCVAHGQVPAAPGTWSDLPFGSRQSICQQRLPQAPAELQNGKLDEQQEQELGQSSHALVEGAVTEIGRESGREREGEYVEISVVAMTIKK